jgi:hypothetical protein
MPTFQQLDNEIMDRDCCLSIIGALHGPQKSAEKVMVNFKIFEITVCCPSFREICFTSYNIPSK